MLAPTPDAQPADILPTPGSLTALPRLPLQRAAAPAVDAGALCRAALAPVGA